MNKVIVIIGIGELGSIFARGFLRSRYPVYPVTRDMDISEVAKAVPEPELALIAVAENDISEVCATIPTPWRDRIGLLQNELLPKDWKAHKIEQPTVISVWFEKKKGMDYNVFIPSPVYGPKGKLIADCLASIDIPCNVLSSEDELLFELVVKNVFVITINIAGFETGGTTGILWSDHNQLARKVANDVIDLQEWITGTTFARDRLIAGMVEGINGAPDHKCMGRAAPGRLERVIDLANKANLKIPKIREIHKKHQSTN